MPKNLVLTKRTEKHFGFDTFKNQEAVIRTFWKARTHLFLCRQEGAESLCYQLSSYGRYRYCSITSDCFDEKSGGCDEVF